MAKDMSYILTLLTIMEISKMVINRVKEFLYGIMERSIGVNGAKGKSMAQEHGKVHKGKNSPTSANGTMGNHMVSESLQTPLEMSIKVSSNYQSKTVKEPNDILMAMFM